VWLFAILPLARVGVAASADLLRPWLIGLGGMRPHEALLSLAWLGRCVVRSRTGGRRRSAPRSGSVYGVTVEENTSVRLLRSLFV
jgi:hypothetical protein